jgi:hypothetical protein
MLRIVSNSKEFVIRREECLQLELKLNISEFGKEWKSIGDILYDKYCNKCDIEQIDVSDQQWNFLNMLNNMQYEEYKCMVYSTKYKNM